METTFRAFSPAALRFLLALEKNNRREWFQPRKQEYEELLQAPMLALATRINVMLEKAAPGYAMLEPGKALNRIYRDTRFSADKTPYKTNVSMLFPHQRLGKKSGAALYVSLSGKELMLAAGMYFGETRELQAVREHLAAKHAEFRSILTAKAIRQTFGELSGDSLQKTPKQFGIEHPAADLLKRKQWLLSSQRPSQDALDQSFAENALKSLKALIPFVDFLNAPLRNLPAKVLPDV